MVDSKAGSRRKSLRRIGASALDWAFDRLERLPIVRTRIERKYDALLDEAASALRPYRGRFPTFRDLPKTGLGRQAALETVRAMTELEREHWSNGRVSGAVYHGDSEHIDFQNQVYALASQQNPLHADLWPSATKFEAEIVAMTARLLGAPPPSLVNESERITGTVTSGGTESILLAMKVYRELARKQKSLGKPQVIVPDSAHAAFDKAAELLDMEVVRVPVESDFRASVSGTRRAISPRTVALVASAPCFPHGVIDPIQGLADLAREHELGLHVDACLGGFVLPFARELGHAIPAFDFRVPEVTSMSADTHKYGYAAKGTSVVLYRGAELRRLQYFVSADWSGGLYFSPTLAGSRPGALSAACWASMIALGEEGYLDATRRILDAAQRIKSGIESIPELYLLGDPLWVLAFAAKSIDIYRVLDALHDRGWTLNGLQHPPSIHLCVTLTHTQPGVAEQFIADLREAVEDVRSSPPRKGGMAPIYGLSGSFPVRGAVKELLRRYVDRLYEP